MNVIEAYVRSRSYDLAFKRGKRHFNGQRSHFTFDRRPVCFRIGSSDAGDALEILFSGRHCIYRLPAAFRPSVIWDIGANIGLATLYFKKRYPHATIHAFEPQKENFQLLQLNTSGLPGVNPCAYALGEQSGEIELAAKSDRSTNSYSSVLHGDNQASTETVPIRSVREVLQENHDRVVDLIKIDTEGAEYDILSAFPHDILTKATVVVGELHGYKDEQTLALLQPGFDITMRKRSKSTSPYTNFLAINRQIHVEYQ